MNNPETEVRWPEWSGEILRPPWRLACQSPPLHLSHTPTILPNKYLESFYFSSFDLFHHPLPCSSFLTWPPTGLSEPRPHSSPSPLCTFVTRGFFKSTRLCISFPQLCTFNAFPLLLGERPRPLQSMALSPSTPVLLTCSSQADLFRLLFLQYQVPCYLRDFECFPHCLEHFASISRASFRFTLNCHFFRNSFFNYSSFYGCAVEETGNAWFGPQIL